MLRHYLALRKEGVPLYSFTNELTDPHYAQDEFSVNTSIAKNDTLFSGLLSSFVTFSKDLGGTLQQIKLDNIDLYMHEINGIIGVAFADPSNEPEKIETYKEITETITDRFVTEYESDLHNWDGNVTKFENFNKVLEQSEIMKDEVKLAEICKSCLISCCNVDTDVVK